MPVDAQDVQRGDDVSIVIRRYDNPPIISRTVEAHILYYILKTLEEIKGILQRS